MTPQNLNRAGEKAQGPGAWKGRPKNPGKGGFLFRHPLANRDYWL